MPQLLIELFSEEIPARMQLGAAKDFERLFDARLKAQGLGYESMKAYVGPRRLALVVDGLPGEQAAVTEETKGPKEGAPPQAMEGFLRKVGLAQNQLVLENGVWMARVEKAAQKTVALLPAMLEDIILNFPWPKSMRSGTSTFRWVRPLKRILFLFDGAVVPFELEGLKAANLTEGHRFLGSGSPFVVEDFAAYQRCLRDEFVIIDHPERQEIIFKKASEVCDNRGFTLIEDAGLLEEVAGLNEWPVPILGDMDAHFLTLPPEVIKTSMRTHQKYFAVLKNEVVMELTRLNPGLAGPSSMAAQFVIVANIQAVDGGAEIKRGNAKVLSARLSDAVFFWKEDNRANNFDQWLTKLKGVTFHAKLGTMAERASRIVALAEHIAPFMGVNVADASEAARLSKADLASYMVGEFPELQGVMGGYYAQAARLGDEISSAIRDHYKPQGPSDNLPSTPLGAVVALADKLDTLVGFFAIDEKPTGSKDPYALRRSALGILRILRDHGLRLSIADLVHQWYKSMYQVVYPGSPNPQVGSGRIEFRGGQISLQPEDGVASELQAFFTDRLKVMLKEEGARHDVLEAVFAIEDDDMVRAIARKTALEAVLARPEGEDLIAAYKRVGNILAAEAKKGGLPDGLPVALSGAPEAETQLVLAVTLALARVDAAIEKEKFGEALLELAALRKKVDNFLDNVLVNADESEVRLNRLRILNAVHGLTRPVADLSRLA